MAGAIRGLSADITANVMDTLHAHARLVLGFSCLFLWTWVVLQDSFLYEADIEIFSGAIYSWTLSTVSFALTFVGIGVASRFFDFTFSGPRALLVAFVGMLAGSLCICISFQGVIHGGAASVFAFVGSCLAGVSSPFLYLETARLNLGLKLTRIISIISIAVICSSFLYLLLSAAPLGVGSWAVALLPVGIIVALWPSRRVVKPAVRANGEGLYIPWKLNFTACAMGLGFGAGRLLLAEMVPPETLAARQGLFYVLGYTTAACMFVVIAPLMRQRFDTLIYKIGFPLLALGTVVVITPPLEGVGCFVSALGYRFIDITVWTLSVYLAMGKSVPLSWITGWNTACLYLGMLAGQVVASTFTALPSDTYCQLGVGVISFAMMAAALYATNVFNNDNAWGVLRPSSAHAVRPSYIKAVCALSDRTGLTPRQRDVLSGLGLGKSMAEVADELGISKQTVKVHARNLYAALGVHSQRELCDMVAGEVKHIEERLS